MVTNACGLASSPSSASLSVRTVIITQAQHIAETIKTLAGAEGPLEFSREKLIFDPAIDTVRQRKALGRGQRDDTTILGSNKINSPVVSSM